MVGIGIGMGFQIGTGMSQSLEWEKIEPRGPFEIGWNGQNIRKDRSRKVILCFLYSFVS